MNLFLAIAENQNLSVSSFIPVIYIVLIVGALLIAFVGRAVTALDRLSRAHEKLAQAQQDTVYLLREIATKLKSKEEKQP